MTRYRIGIVGLGKMGRGHLQAAAASARWEVTWLCDLCDGNLAAGATVSPRARATTDTAEVFNDDTLDAVALCTLADSRPALIRQALAEGLHISAEKPLAATVEEETALLEEIERSRSIVAVNLFNRNAWYHREAREAMVAGEIGDLAVVRACHMTPMVLPPDFHAPEGPVFHDCGMHYVDVARWYANSEYAAWHAVALRLFEEPLPLWGSSHGHFENGVAFEITNGFMYGLHAKEPRNNSTFDVIGTHGAIHISHDFANATLQIRGVSRTVDKTAPYGGKKLDVMYDKLARAIDSGDDSDLPGARDSAIASRVSQEMIDSAMAANPPNVGRPEQLAEIRQYRGSD